MKTLRIKSINGDISFQDVTLQIYPYDFVPIVNLDLEQLSPNPQNKRVYDGFEIKKNEGVFTTLSHYVESDKRKQQLYSIFPTDEKDEFIVRFFVRQGNSKAIDNNGFIRVEAKGVKILTKNNKLTVNYGWAIALKISAEDIEEEAYINFYADDNDHAGAIDIFCGRVNVMRRTVKKLEVNEGYTQKMSGAPVVTWNNTFAQEAKYLIRLRVDNVIVIQVRLFADTNLNVKKSWKDNIEEKWNDKAEIKINGKNYKISFEIIWTEKEKSHHIIIVDKKTKKNSTSGNKGTESAISWSSKDIEDVTHEFGHLLGNKDEYYIVDGISYGPGRQAGKGIMNNPSENPKKNHFEKIRLNIAKMLDIDEKKCIIIMK